jgi:hypothetical protein
MKRLLVFAMLAVAAGAHGQLIVDGQDLAQLDIKYIEIVAVSKVMSSKVVVVVDYGQGIRSGAKQTITDMEGKSITFMSVIDALNYMDKHGWTYIDNYLVTLNNQSVIRYLLRRKE